MGGANYMGGKRNAARNRTKDTATRAQKRFFGQQKYKNLSLGASGNADMFPTKAANHPGKSLPSIGLAHARQKKGLPDDEDDEGAENKPLSFIPSPIHLHPCTPKSKAKKARLLAATSSASSAELKIQSSEVLELIDTTEPWHLRAAMDRILALDDLAGLSGLPSPPRKAKRSHSSSPCPTERKRRRKEESEPATAQGNEEEPYQSDSQQPSFSTHDEDREFIPQYPEDDIFAYGPSLDESDQELSDDVQPAHPINAAPEKEKVVSSSPSSDISDWDMHGGESPYSMRRTVQKPSSTEKPYLGLNYSSSSDPSRNPVRPPTISPTPLPRQRIEYSPSSTPSSIQPQTPLNPASLSKPMRNGLPQGPNAPKSLLDYPDPWKAVGVLMGLETFDEPLIFPLVDAKEPDNDAPSSSPSREPVWMMNQRSRGSSLRSALGAGAASNGSVLPSRLSVASPPLPQPQPRITKVLDKRSPRSSERGSSASRSVGSARRPLADITGKKKEAQQVFSSGSSSLPASSPVRKSKSLFSSSSPSVSPRRRPLRFIVEDESEEDGDNEEEFTLTSAAQDFGDNENGLDECRSLASAAQDFGDDENGLDECRSLASSSHSPAPRIHSAPHEDISHSTLLTRAPFARSRFSPSPTQRNVTHTHLPDSRSPFARLAPAIDSPPYAIQTSETNLPARKPFQLTLFTSDRTVHSRYSSPFPMRLRPSSKHDSRLVVPTPPVPNVKHVVAEKEVGKSRENEGTPAVARAVLVERPAEAVMQDNPRESDPKHVDDIPPAMPPPMILDLFDGTDDFEYDSDEY